MVVVVWSVWSGPWECSGPVTDSLTAGIVLQINWLLQLLQQYFSKYIRDIRQPRAGVKCAGLLAGLQNINIKTK